MKKTYTYYNKVEFKIDIPFFCELYNLTKESSSEQIQLAIDKWTIAQNDAIYYTITDGIRYKIKQDIIFYLNHPDVKWVEK